MKRIFAFLSFAILILSACADGDSTATPLLTATPTATAAATSTATPTPIPTIQAGGLAPFATPCMHISNKPSITDEANHVRYVVENFGKRLQNVSLQSPDAAQEMQKQYSEFVSAALLETWMNDISKAPGRIVSSPWPDRIEITALTKEGSDKYVIAGFVVEVTSMEIVSGGAAAEIPVRIVVQKDQGRWLITEYAEER